MRLFASGLITGAYKIPDSNIQIGLGSWSGKPGDVDFEG
jgi:hypothetical protein